MSAAGAFRSEYLGDAMKDRTAVGRIVAAVDVQNAAEPRRLKKIDALVDPRRRAVEAA